ncbi:MAG: hypothetical protein HDR44_01165 [Allobaculum sp.]|nr:hypothetical protein [Allobaculum sp.]
MRPLFGRALKEAEPARNRAARAEVEVVSVIAESEPLHVAEELLERAKAM